MWHTLGFLACLLVSVQADITGSNPPPGQCICVDASSVNVRDGPCGSSIGSSTVGDCWQYNYDNKQVCDLSGTTYEFFDLAYGGTSGWIAGTLLVFGSDIDCDIVEAPDPEHRSFFIATAWNVDWPTSSSDSSSAQQAQMVTYMDHLVTMNMNAVVFQIRPAGDAFYDSPIDPWSRYLTGTQGTAPNPYYDPLAFTITEAHNRGIEVHAWLNPYRANLSPNYDGLAPNHMCNTFSQYCYIYDNYLWMDPGAQEVVDHLVNVITDVVTRYDVDGIHFDDYFYPYPDGPFPDDDTYQDYLNGGGSLPLDEWRRQNVNTMVETVYNTIRGLSSTVKFSISPFGIYRPGHPEGMPSPISGLDPYTAQYADPKFWFQSGWVDFLGPQLYWAIDPPAQSYPVILDWWLGVNTLDRHIYVANGVYKIDDSNDWPVSEILNQVAISRDEGRRTGGSLGNVHYSAQFFRDNTKGIRDAFVNQLYPTPASVPPMPWLGLKLPAEPDVTAHGSYITWEARDEDVTHTWAVYKKMGLKWVMLKKLAKSVTGYNVKEPGIYAIRAANRANELSDLVVVSVIDLNGQA